MAIIDKSCNFSRFDGIDRSIVVLDGGGIILKSSANSVAIGIKDQPVSFTDEEDITATPIGKAKTTDLNVMTRRGFFSHQMAECSFYEHEIIEAVADITFIIAKSDVIINGQKIHHLDTITGFEKTDKIEMKAYGKGQIFIIDLFRH